MKAGLTGFDDGLTRCDWTPIGPGADAQLYRDYHDQEWGRPLRGRRQLFERMSLEAFQSGLSWLIILRKRDNFRSAFDGFDIETVAGYDDADVTRLMADAGIVRNRAKIHATIANARAAADLDVDLSDLLWSFAPPPRPRPHGCPTCRHVGGVHRDGQRTQAPRLQIRRTHHRLRAHAGHRNGRRPRRGVLGFSG